MICCFRRKEQLFKLNSLVEVKLSDGETLKEPVRWVGFLATEGGQFKKWVSLPCAQLAEVEADMVATHCPETHGGIWAHLPPETSLGAIVFDATRDSGREMYRPAKILTRPAPELKSYLRVDRYPLVGRMEGSLVFKRSSKDFILKW